MGSVALQGRRRKHPLNAPLRTWIATGLVALASMLGGGCQAEPPSPAAPSDVSQDLSGPDAVTDVFLPPLDATDTQVNDAGDGDALPPADVAPADTADDVDPVDTTPPAPIFGNTCDLPIDIAAGTLPFAQSANTGGASDDYSLGGGCDTGGDIGKGIPELVYRFVPAVTGHHILGLSPATFTGENPTVIYVATSCADISETCVAVSSNLTGGGIFSAYLEAGVVYWIIADGLLASDKGPFTLIVDEAVCVPQCPGPGTSCGKDGCGGECGVGCVDEEICATDGHCVAGTSLSGNTCEQAFTVDTLPFTGSGDTYYASDSLAVAGGECPGEPDPMGALSNDHVYKLVAPETGIYAITLKSDYDAALYLVSDCESPAQSCKAGSDSSLIGEFLEVELTQGESAFIIVDGFGGDDNDHGTYGLTVSAPCVPNCQGKSCGSDGCSGSCGACGAGEACNGAGVCAVALTGDDCNAPFIVGALPFSHSADTSDFEGDFFYEAGDCPGVGVGWGKGSQDTVYYFEAPFPDLYRLQVEADFDTTLYVGTSCEDISNTCLMAADDAMSGEEIAIWLDAGDDLFIVVDGYGNLSSPSGAYVFTVTPACLPMCEGLGCGDDGCGGSCGACVNGTFCNEAQLCAETPGDSCALPFEILSVPALVTGDTGDATDVYGVPYDACPGEISVRGASSRDEVWSFTPEASGVYTLQVNAAFITSVYVLTDCDLFVESCFVAQDPGPLAWWKVEQACKDTGEACRGITTGVGVDDSVVTLAVWMDAGVGYFIVVDGESFSTDENGPYSLTVSEPCTPLCAEKACGSDGCGLTCGDCALGDVCNALGQCDSLDGNTCDTAWPILELPFEATGSTFDATNVYGLPQGVCEDQEDPGGAGSRDEVYVFTPDESALYEVVISSNFNALVYVLTDCSQFQSSCFFPEALGYYQWVAQTGDCTYGDACTAMSFPEEGGPLQAELEAGVTYYVIVDGSGGLADFWGNYTLTFDKACVPQCEDKACGSDGCGKVCALCPDGFECSDAFSCVDVSSQEGNTCALAWEVGSIPFLGTGDTGDDADIYPGNPCGNGSLGSKDEVWTFTPDHAGVYVFSVKPDPPFKTVYAVVKNCVDLSFDCVVSTDAETISETLEGNETYFIIVDAHEDGAPSGTYVLEVKEAL